MNRLTRERLEEIRKYASEAEVSKEIHDLLSEIEALTVDVDKLAECYVVSLKALTKLSNERDLLRSHLKIAVEALELIQMRREGFENDLWRCPVMASEGLEAIRKVGVPDEA